MCSMCQKLNGAASIFIEKYLKVGVSFCLDDHHIQGML